MRFAVLILLLVFPLLSHSEVYRWVDENGQVHFGSVPPKQQKPYKAGEIKNNDKKRKAVVKQNKSNQDVKVETDSAINNESVSKKDDSSIDKSKNTEKSNVKAVINYKPRSQDEKILDKERDKKRDEKFNALIKRIKSNLGTIKKQSQEKDRDENNEKVNIKEAEGGKDNNNQENMADKKAVVEKSKLLDEEKNGKEDIEVNKEIESVEQAVVKDNEKCGFFMSFVENYEDRVKYECPSEHCDILYKKLEKYRNKVKQYCDSNMLEGAMIEAE